MSENTLLDKLEGLSIRFEEVGTLITDPAVISDMKRFVKLTKEYSDLEKIVKAKNQYEKLLNNISEARSILWHIKIRIRCTSGAACPSN